MVLLKRVESQKKIHSIFFSCSDQCQAPVIDRALQDARWVIVLWSQSPIHSQWLHKGGQRGSPSRIVLPLNFLRI
jgi:hypothetical protein